jgi:hypothetical protein
MGVRSGVATVLMVCGLAAAQQTAPPLTLPSPSAPTAPAKGTQPAQPAPTTPPSETTQPSTLPPTTRRPEEPSTGTVDLRPKFKAGQQIRYVFDQVAKNQIKSSDPSDNSMDQDQEQTERIGLVMKVVEAGDDGATIQVVYESIKVTLKTPDGPAEYDSTKPKPTAKSPSPTPSTKSPTKPGTPTIKSPSTTPAPGGSDPLKDIADLDTSGMLGLIVGPMVGSVITVKTDKNGAVTSVSGGEALGGGMGLPGGGGMVPNPTQMANWLVAGVGGPNNSGRAKVGESWTDNDSLAGTPVGSFKMVTKNTLESATGGAARVSFTGHIEPASEGAAPGTSAGQVQSAAYTGKYVWDTRGGALSEMSTNMSVTMDGGVMGAKGRLSSDTRVQVKRVP